MAAQRKTADEIRQEQQDDLAGVLRDKGKVEPNHAEELAKLLLDAGYQAPDKRKVKPLRPFILANHLGVRPPWAWFQLDDDAAEITDEFADDFVTDYNLHLTVTEFDVIPACWRQHPYMIHLISALAWDYYATHRSPDARPEAAIGFHERTLWLFRERLTSNLGPTAAACRDGRHPIGKDPDPDVTEKRGIYMDKRDDPDQRGPILRDVLQDTWFGTQ